MHKPLPTLICLAALLLATGAQAKLPAPSDEAKAKAAEAAAKTAWSGKVDAYKLCMAQDKLAASYRASAKKAGKDVGATTDTPACADPGPFARRRAGGGRTGQRAGPGQEGLTPASHRP